MVSEVSGPRASSPRNEGKSVFRGEVANHARHPAAVGMDAVIDVGDGQLEAERLSRGVQQIQQGYGVGTAGDGDQQMRRCDVERREDALETRTLNGPSRCATAVRLISET